MLKSEGLWCDAAAFRLEVECHRYPEALRLYSGPLLDGFYVTAASEFEQWLEDAVTLYDDALAADPENAYCRIFERTPCFDYTGMMRLWKHKEKAGRPIPTTLEAGATTRPRPARRLRLVLTPAYRTVSTGASSKDNWLTEFEMMEPPL